MENLRYLTLNDNINAVRFIHAIKNLGLLRLHRVLVCPAPHGARPLLYYYRLDS